jgi:hypothetical protein
MKDALVVPSRRPVSCPRQARICSERRLPLLDVRDVPPLGCRAVELRALFRSLFDQLEI